MTSSQGCLVHCYISGLLEDQTQLFLAWKMAWEQFMAAVVALVKIFLHFHGCQSRSHRSCGSRTKVEKAKRLFKAHCDPRLAKPQTQTTHACFLMNLTTQMQSIRGRTHTRAQILSPIERAHFTLPMPFFFGRP